MSEKEENNIEDIDIFSCLETAFPNLEEETFTILTSWYEDVIDENDFETNEDFVDFVLEDIEEMLDSQDPSSDKKEVLDDLIANEYIDPSDWEDALKECE